MNSGPISSRNLLLLIASLALTGTSHAASPAVESIRTDAKSLVASAEADAATKKADLAKKYAAALDTLEKKLTADGDLDIIMNVHEEKKSVEATGAVTAHADKPLLEIRAKYLKPLEAIDDSLKAARARAGTMVKRKLAEQEAALAKAGKTAEAEELQQEGEALQAEYPDPGTGGDGSAPGAGASSAIASLEAIKLPTETPPPFDKPMSIVDRWLDPMTIPTGKQKVRKHIVIGDRGKKNWPLVVISPGSAWSGGDGARIELSGGNVLATQSRFEDIALICDHACHYYFRYCSFKDCKLERGGIWWGGDLPAKYYLEGCIITGKFSKPIQISDNGYRIQTSVFQNVDLPQMSFGKHQPADYLNEKWLRIVNCRFVKCTVPVSFLLLTRDCIFEGCTFTDNPEKKADESEMNKLVEIVAYVADHKNKIKDLPRMMKLTEKPVSALQGSTIPTAAALEALIGK
ncbi:hypothetical protein [Luteolibacter sp. Populi]|uniref:hypothetical protein n=1 Tax=Luteolibacter sp. Populi TaxID=3230487 RepID=UPI0034660C5C